MCDSLLNLQYILEVAVLILRPTKYLYTDATNFKVVV